MPASSLWTPGGMVSTGEKDVVAISASDLAILARFHEFANKYGISVVCKRCDSAFTGKNSGHETTSQSVSCQCRELRYTR